MPQHNMKPRREKNPGRRDFAAPNSMMEPNLTGQGVGAFNIAPNTPPSLTPPPAWSFTFESGAPRSLVHKYAAEFETHMDGGKSRDDAHHLAIREIQRAGWMKTKDGWKQVLPDLRDKVAVTEGILQPDGTYFIEGVPVFHPNAVKGIPFDAAKIKQIIKNTNEGIASGGTKPVIVEGHPPQLRETTQHPDGSITVAERSIPEQLDAHGAAVNFREDPDRPPGYVVCDFVSVTPEYFERLKGRKLPGLSAGFARDSNELNRRFGHVALLGGTSPALSHLPATEFFQSTGSNYLCFGADLEIFPKGKSMLNAKAKECYAAMASAKEAYDAAEMAQSTGQPDGDARMNEAYAALSKAKENFDAAMGGTMDGGGPLGNTVQDEETPATIGNGSAAGEYGNVPPAEMPTPGSTAPQAPMTFSAMEEKFSDASYLADHPDELFSAIISRGKDLEKQLAAEREARVVANNVARAREMWLNFSSEIETLRRGGRVGIPEAKLIREEFESFADNRDPIKAMKIAIKRYQSLPAARTPATVNRGEPVFSAPGDDGSQPLNGKPLPPQKRDKVQIQRALGQTASPEEVMFAAIGESIDWEKSVPAK